MLYLAVAELGHLLSFPDQPFATFWPAAGLFAAVLVRLGPARWPGFLAASLAAGLASDLLVHGVSPATALAYWAANAGEACLGAWLLRAAVGGEVACRRPREVFRLVGLSALLSPALAATAAAAALSWAGAIGSFGEAWRLWWAADALGVFVVAPLLLASPATPSPRRGARAAEFAVAVGLLLVVAARVFSSAETPESPLWRLPYTAIFPFLLWVGCRFEVRATALASALLGLLATWMTTRGTGPFAWGDVDPGVRAVLLQMYVASAALAPLLVASAFAELRRAERAAREGERRFRAVFDQAFQFVGLLAPDGTLLEANRTALDFVGARREGVVDRPFRDTPWWSGRPDLQEALGRAIEAAARGDTSRFEAQHVGADGVAVTVDFSLKPSLDEDGRVALLIAEGRDMTDRVRSEGLARANEALRASEAGLRGLADAMPQIVWTALPDGRIDYYNERWYEYTGMPRGCDGDASWTPILHPEDRPRCLELWYRSVRTGEPFQMEYRFLDRRGGGYRWHLGRALPVRGRDGAVVRWFGTCTDIDRQKRVEEELRVLNESHERRVEARTAELAAALAEQRRAAAALKLSEARFREAFEASALGVALVGLDGRWLKVNPSLCRILGHTPDELLAMRFQDITHPDDLDADLGLTRRLLAGEIPSYQMEKRYIRPGGAAVWVVLSVSLVRDSAGRPVHFVSQIEDVTARRLFEEELRRARDAATAAARAKAAFLANMSHEIRTPMNGVLGMAELALAAGPAAGQRECLESIKACAEGLLTVIDDILDFSKVDAGKLDLDRVPFDVRAALDESLAPLAIRAHAKGVHLCGRVAPEVPATLVGDPHRLRQVLLNLAGNAVKFTEAGEVSVSVDLDDAGADDPGRATLRVSVSDTGPGVPEGRRAAIFEPFEQADGSTTRTHGGTGLGLTISARLVGLMGGRIWVEANAPRGSVFRFTARFDLPGEGAAAGCDPPSPSLGAGLRVLVVEPHETCRRNLDELLRSWGLRPTLASDRSTAGLAMRAAASGGRPFRAMIVADDDLADAVAADPAAAGAGLVVLGPPGAAPDPGGASARAARLSKPVRGSELFDALASAMGVEAATAGAAPRDEAGPEPRPGRPLSVLVAEDNETNQVVARGMLERLGHRAEVVGDGRAALDALEAGPFDLVLMDVQMPVMDGFQAVAAIRARGRKAGRRVPVVALTAHAMAGDRERCLAAGFDGYLAKPIRLKTLKAVLEAASSRGAGGGGREEGPASRFRPEGLEECFGGEPEPILDVVERFEADLVGWLERSDAALAAGDAAGLAQLAHKARGACLMLGAGPTAAAFEALERSAGRGDLGAAAARLDAVREAWGGLARELDRYADRLRKELAARP